MGNSSTLLKRWRFGDLSVRQLMCSAELYVSVFICLVNLVFCFVVFLNVALFLCVLERSPVFHFCSLIVHVLVTHLISSAPYLVNFILFEVLFVLTLLSLFLARLWEPVIASSPSFDSPTVPCESIRPPWTLRPFATFQASNINI